MARLKQLDINGFKSFANPTSFVFDCGVTAIIGPNGSGKSNIAEALRWVLGEQQYSNLRGRRTEDVIFAGSDRRGRMGMAEVSLTIDNSSGLLPIEFSEVNVTRRAHRSGENQYLINGNRVRLKDLQQLTAPLGQAHTIVGQGLVDAVLSQRPEDRRGLFEHAAGITGLRMQTVSAERGLQEAEENAQLLGDIIGELDPRVRSRARRAHQAEQYEGVREELTRLQRGYYGALWIEAETRLKHAADAHSAAKASADAGEQRHTAALDHYNELRQLERQLASEQSQATEHLSTIEAALSDARHRLDLVQAESRAARERANDHARTRQRIEAEQATRTQDLTSLDEQIEALKTELQSQSKIHDQLATRHAEARQRRAEMEDRLTTIDDQRRERTRRLNELSTTLAGQSERSQILRRSMEAIEQRQTDLNQRVETLEREIELAEREGAESQQLVESTRHRRDETERNLDKIERDLRQEHGEVGELDRQLDRMRGRLDLLERIWAEGEGLHAGVRAILRSVRQGDIDMPGLIGTVAEAIDVPEDVETAIEVALGGHLQDLIVRTWDDAAAGIAFLKSSGEGRARFQPLDSLRRYRERTLAARPDGLIDRAAGLIRYDDEIAPVVDQLLGRTLVARDLDAAHRIAGEIEGWTIVTLQGELVAPAGSVTGGARTRGASLLARERERRELPAGMNEIERRLEAKRDSIRTLQQRQEREVARLEQLDRELAGARSRVWEILEHLAGKRRELDAERAAIARQDEELQLLEADIGKIDAASGPITTEQNDIIEDIESLDAERATVAALLDELPALDDAELRELSTELAAIRERLRATERERANLSDQIARTDRENDGLAEEVARINARLAELNARAAQIGEEAERLAQEREEARISIPPLSERLLSIRADIESAEQSANQQARRLRDAERALDQAALDVARAEDGVELLRGRIMDDLEISDPALLLEDATEASDEVEQAIRRLRERLRRMGSVGEDVIEEHREESERLDYLSNQINDVTGAAESLHQVLGNLRRQMGTRFSETFEDVAKEFEATFQRLFGGGTARLSHETVDSEPGGIDIVVRPPGKRLQGLNQLSGGERALTAVALLIAIQRVNPSPFCLLDEVDAALDESNVIRFRQELRDLARDTQYIVITHNLGTIEGADTLYGITMGDDSVSRVLSLRLDQAIQAIEDDQLLEMESVI
ncbi:chromosome segregation protein SMC [soil metagenome]